MSKPALIISNETPIIQVFNSKAEAVKAGRTFQRENNDDPRWQVVDLEVVTVIWGDTEDEPGVFHFHQVSADSNNFAETARQNHFKNYPDDWRDGRTDAQLCAMAWTLIAVLPGKLSEL